MEILKPYRDRIDSLDDQIVDLLAARMAIVREVGRIKAAHGIPSVLSDRVEQVRERVAMRATAQGVDAEMVRRLYTLLIEHCCVVEDEIRHRMETGS